MGESREEVQENHAKGVNVKEKSFFLDSELFWVEKMGN